MSITKSTIVVYEYSGSTNELTVPFDYLKRDFVVVALGGDGKPQKALKLGTDYRFATKTTIIITRQYQPEEGYNKVIIRRVTDASKRIINYQDGSILNASELNTSQLQALHVAEEARDLANYTLFVDDNNNLDARGRKIINLGDPTNPQDAVTKKYVDTASESVINSRDRAEAAAVKAEGYRDETLNAKEHVDAVGAYLEAKLEKADALNTSATKNATDAIEASNKATQAATEAEESNKEAQKAKEAAAQSAIEAKGYSDKINPHKLIQNVKDIATLKTSVFEEGYTVFVQEYSTGIVDSCHYRVIEREEGLDGILLSNGLYANILHNGEVNVKWFGAKGDGLTDDADMFIKASTSGASIFITRGTYLVNKPLDLTKCPRFVGEGSNLVKLKITGTVRTFITKNGDDTQWLEEISGLGNAITTEASLSLDLETIGSLVKDDVCVIWDSTDSSYSKFRTAYRKGEFFEIEKIIGNTLQLKTPLYDVYKKASSVKVYKHKGTGFVIGGFALETSLQRGPQAIGMALNGIIGLNVFDIKSNTWGAIGILVSRSYKVLISNCDIDMSQLEATSNNYCISIGNSQDVIIKDCNLKSVRHCIAHGGNDNIGSIVVRNTLTTGCTLKGTSGNHAFDSHGNSEYVKITNCFIYGGVVLSGNYSTVSACTLIGSRQSTIFRLAELSGFTFTFDNNHIRNNYSNYASGGSVLDIGGNTQDLTDKTVKGGLLSFKNNRVFQSCSSEVSGGQMVYIRNRGCIKVIDIDIIGNVFEYDADAPDKLPPRIIFGVISGSNYRNVNVKDNDFKGVFIQISRGTNVVFADNTSSTEPTPKNFGVSDVATVQVDNAKTAVLRNNVILSASSGGFAVIGSNTGECLEFYDNVVKSFNKRAGSSTISKCGLYIGNIGSAIVKGNHIEGSSGDFSVRCGGTVASYSDGLNTFKQGDTVYNSPFKPIGVNSIIPLCINVTKGTQVPSYTPSYIGETYVDTQGKKSYIAVGLTSSDWKVLNA